MAESGSPRDLRLLERRLKAIANRKRLEILKFLRKEQSAIVTDIARGIQLSLTATSKHLQLLQKADIVVTRKRGLFVTYRLSLDQQSPVREVLKLL